MKRIVLIAILSLATVSFAACSSPAGNTAAVSTPVPSTPTVSDESLKQTLLQLQREEDEAEWKKDAATLDRLLTKDFFVTFPNGVFMDKASYLAGIKGEAPKTPYVPPAYEVKDVRSYGDAAVMNYVVTFKQKDKAGKEANYPFRITITWVKLQNRWQQAAAHVSDVKSSDAK